MAEERSPVHIRLYRAKSWMDRAKNLVEKDLDGCFIFYWIAFNALYGQPKYLDPKGQGTNELEDIHRLLELITILDSTGQLYETRKLVKLECDKLLADPYLKKYEWVKWYDQKLETVDERKNPGFLSQNKRSDLLEVFKRLYVLRNQVFHGCSADGSSKNRSSLKRAIKVLRVFVPLFHDLIHANQADVAVAILLGELPYPPSIGGIG